MENPPPPTTNPRRRTSIGSAAAVAFADDVDSGSEKCGFVCHVLVVLLTAAAVTSRLALRWVRLPLWWNGAPDDGDSFGSSNDDDSSGGSRLQEEEDPWRTSPPRGSLMVVPQTAIACLFFAALFLIYVVTAWNCSYRLDALETIQDEYNNNSNNNKTQEALLHRQPADDENTSARSSRSDGISDIADLDVPTINDLVWEARTK